MIRLFGFVALSVVVGDPAALAADKPSAADLICVRDRVGGRIVDKGRLASFLLSTYGFNLGALPDTPPSAELAGLDPKRRVVSDPAICRDNAACKAAEVSSVRSFRGFFGEMLSGQSTAFRPSAPNLEPAAYMVGPNERNAVGCLGPSWKAVDPPVVMAGATKPGQDQTQSGAPPAPDVNATNPPGQEQSFWTNFRVRGAASDLYIDRRDPLFKSASQAVASLASDGVTGRTTNTLQSVIGYSIPTGFFPSTSGEELILVPYVSVDRVLTGFSPGKAGKASATEIVGGGIMATASFPLGALVNRLNVRPSFLSNLRDDSSIASINLQYLPVRAGFVNAYIPLEVLDTRVASIRPILDLRLDSGTYTNRGNSAVRLGHRDFARLGGQAGASLLSDVSSVPVELRSTYTGLYGARGGKNIGLFDNSVNLALDEKRYISLTLAYSNGNREDTAERQQQWLAGLSVRY